MKEERRREEGERKERGRRWKKEKEEEKRKTGNRFLLLTCFSLHLVLVDVFFNQPLSQREVDVLYHCLIP